MIIILWIIVGLIINYLLWWFPFSTLLCIAAAIFIILPALLNLKKEEIINILKNKKKIILVSLIANFVILPLIAGLLRYLLFWKTNIEILYWILLLSIIPWWWLLATYLKLSKADLHLWITLFWINLFFFWLYFIPFTILLDLINLKNNTYQSISYQKNLKTNQQLHNLFENQQVNKLLKNFSNSSNQPQPHCVIEETSKKLWINLSSCFLKNWKINPLIGLYGFLILIVFPLILLWIIKYLNLYQLFTKFNTIISKIWTFGIITYIFSLKQIREIFTPQFENILLKVFFLTLAFYIITYTLWYIISNYLLKNKKEEKFALFWNITTRFITLWLIIASVYAYYLNNFSITTIFIISYFIQIWLSALFVNYLKLKSLY